MIRMKENRSYPFSGNVDIDYLGSGKLVYQVIEDRLGNFDIESASWNDEDIFELDNETYKIIYNHIMSTL